MRRRGMEPMHDEHINVTPLIDVVMCLIIFFLCCTTLAKEESKDGVKIPRAQLGQEMAEQRGRLLINLVPAERDDPTRDAGAAPVAIDPEAKPNIYLGSRRVSLDDLPLELREARKMNPDLKVVLRADEALNYKWISPVLIACTTANISSVNFSTRNQ